LILFRPSSAYKRKLRQLAFNLRKNVDLRVRVCLGLLTPSALIALDAEVKPFHNSFEVLVLLSTDVLPSSNYFDLLLYFVTHLLTQPT